MVGADGQRDARVRLPGEVHGRDQLERRARVAQRHRQLTRVAHGVVEAVELTGVGVWLVPVWAQLATSATAHIAAARTIERWPRMLAYPLTPLQDGHPVRLLVGHAAINW